VMFDFGGVICTPQPQEDLAALAAVAGVSVADFRAAYWPGRRAYDEAALTATGYWQDVAGRLGVTFTGARIGELIRLDIASWAHLRPGTLRLIADLRDAGIRLALLSNAPVEVARAVAAMAMARQFEHLMFSCYFKAAKPDPDCYRQALARLGAPAEQVTFVDDRAENVSAAAALGMRAIRFSEPGQVRAGIFGVDTLLCRQIPVPAEAGRCLSTC
jgi:putative hydrolase of the HAD superfamily